jgi:ceramide glucosyltransferase
MVMAGIGFAYLADISALFCIAFALVAAISGAFFLAKLKARRSSRYFPPVTIIKPLKGSEESLYSNLASYCQLHYPQYQLIFCLQSDNDPALATVHTLKSHFPTLDIDIVISSQRIGYNPKVNNMANAYPLAKYDFLLMSDSDTAVEPNFLKSMILPFEDPRVGLVTAFYEATGSKSFWGHMESLSVNAHFLPQALCAAAFGMRFAMGAAMMVRRVAFDGTGGFPNLADHLADDYWLGESIRNAGWKLELSGSVVETVPDINDPLSHLKHIIRWSRTIRICQPFGHLASFIVHGFTLLTIKIIFFAPSIHSFILLLLLWAMKSLSSAMLSLRIGNHQPLRALWLLPLSEWFSFIAWLCGYGPSQVLWRGDLFHVHAKGKLVPVTPQAAVES